jgi:hypothetical protein
VAASVEPICCPGVPERQLVRGCHLDSRDVPARAARRSLTRLSVTACDCARRARSVRPSATVCRFHVCFDADRSLCSCRVAPAAIVCHPSLVSEDLPVPPRAATATTNDSATRDLPLVERFGSWALLAVAVAAWTPAAWKADDQTAAAAWILAGFVLFTASAFFHRVKKVGHQGVELNDVRLALSEARAVPVVEGDKGGGGEGSRPDGRGRADRRQGGRCFSMNVMRKPWLEHRSVRMRPDQRALIGALVRARAIECF